MKAVLRSVFHHAGGTWLTRHRFRDSVRILMYHRFPAGNILEAQCEHLRKYYRPVSLTEIGHLLQRGQAFPPNAVVFTVDDGYRDFFLRAFPILRAYSIPATVYLATDMLDRHECLWVDWIGVQYQAGGQSRESALIFKESLKRLPDAQRRAALADLPRSLGLAGPPLLPEELAPLTWDEVRQMAGADVEFGAHTRSHPILSKLPSKQEKLLEISGSKSRIESEIGRKAVHFCYPNGHPEDYDEECIEVFRECGFLTAVTAARGVNPRGSDRYRLRRIHQEPVTPLVQYAHQVAGLSR